MITVESLHVYPVKSCRGIELETGEIGPTGFRSDRQWMVVDADGTFLSQRHHPVLARVDTRFEGETLILEGPGRSPLGISKVETSGDLRTVTIWKDDCEAIAAGPEAADWFSSLLGVTCDLVRQPDSGFRQVDPRYAAAGDRVAFADGFPFLLINRASVDDLSRRLADPVPADRFRANIVIDGADPYAEDGWESLEIRDIGFDVAKPCARCVVITTDQHSGARTAEPLKTLASYRRVGDKVLFGQNLVHTRTGTISAGDEVRVIGHRQDGQSEDS